MLYPCVKILSLSSIHSLSLFVVANAQARATLVLGSIMYNDKALQLKEFPMQNPLFLHVQIVLHSSHEAHVIHIGFVSAARGDFIQYD